MLYSSCFENNISEPRGVKNQNQEQLTIIPGKLHNEILAELNKECCLINGAKYDKKEFVLKIVKSSNVIFEKNGININVTNDDIHCILESFDVWKEKGIFDVYTPINKRNVEDVYILLDYLEVHEHHDPVQIRNIRMVIEEIETIGFSNCNQETIHQIISNHESSDRHSELNNVLSIIECSYNFWTDLKSDVEDISIDKKTSVLRNDSVQDHILKVDWWSINVLLWDAVGVLLCWPLGPVSVICGVVASAIYIYITTKD